MSGFFNILWAFLSAMAFPVFISDDTLLFSNSVFSIIFFVAICVVLRQKAYIYAGNDRRLILYTHVLGFVFSGMIAAGRSLDVYGTVSSFKTLIVSILLYTHVIAVLLAVLWTFLLGFEKKLLEPRPYGKVYSVVEKGAGWFVAHPYMITMALLLCWLPCFIADFPGGFRYDATGEFLQTEYGYNGNYPLLHSVIITRLLPAMYTLTGSYNTGIAVYVIVQMLMIAGMYTHIFHTFGKQRVNKILLCIAFLYCAFFPVIQILVVQEVRDVLFSALLLYVMFLFYQMEYDKKAFFQSNGKPALLGLVFVLALLARNNNAGMTMMIIVVAVSAIVWFVHRKNYWKGAAVLAATSILGYVILGAGLTAMCQPLSEADEGGALSLMSQPLARAYLYERDRWTDAEIEELSTYMDLENLDYVPETADPTKSRIHLQNDFLGFLRLWCKIGLKHPGCYLDAILANTQNMWYPGSVIDGYKQMYKEEGQPYYEYEKCYYSIKASVESPGEHRNLLPKVLNYYTQIGLYISFEKVPVISMLFSIGFQFWLVLNCLFYILYRKIYKLVLPVAVILGYMLISACVPLILLRYFAAVFFAFPMLLIFTLQPQHGRE